MLQIANGFVRRPGQSLRFLRALPATLRALQFSDKITDTRRVRSASPPEHLIPNPLRSYFDRLFEGRGLWKCDHYLDIYHRHFSRFAGTEVHVMEVGVYSGGSLQMWKEYFGPQCRVYGVDIHPACQDYEDEVTKIFIGDQADRLFWASVKEAVPTLDILIDDGGHFPEQQITTLEEILPHLRPGGVYLCEDVHGAMNEYAFYARGLALRLNAMISAPDPNRFPATPFQKAVNSYPWVTVIEKHATAVTEFCSWKRGSEWQFRTGDR